LIETSLKIFSRICELYSQYSRILRNDTINKTKDMLSKLEYASSHADHRILIEFHKQSSIIKKI